MSGGGAAARAARSLRKDARWITQFFLRNTLAGSPLLPRVLRAVLYRLLGYRFETVNISDSVVLNNRHVRIGRETRISRGCYFEGSGAVDIGPECMVSPEVAFVTSNHAVTAAGEVSRDPEPLPITIGRRCWLGARVTVLGGTELGDGAVVTAGSVLGGRCAGGFVYSGVPARKVGRVSALAAPDA